MTRAFISEDEARRQAQELLSEPLPPVEPKKKTIRYRERIAARLGKGGKPRDAIVTIDKAQTLRIRPFRGRKTYEMSMEQAVAWLMQKLVVGDKGKPRKRR
jgi:hypothetical protein